jgi:hypothetical protein
MVEYTHQYDCQVSCGRGRGDGRLLLFSPGTNRIRFSAMGIRRQFFQERAARRSGEMAALHGTVRNCNVPCIEGPPPLDWRWQEVERLRGCGPEPCPPCPPRRTHRRAACPTHLASFQPSAREVAATLSSVSVDKGPLTLVHTRGERAASAGQVKGESRPLLLLQDAGDRRRLKCRHRVHGSRAAASSAPS